jgi:competence protein ComFA
MGKDRINGNRDRADSGVSSPCSPNQWTLLFVPRVSDVPKVVKWLARALGVTGSLEERDHRIEQVRLGKQDVLVTTTLLERGVTFPCCHVLVLGLDHPIF